MLLDGSLVQEENTTNAASYYYNCNFSPVSSTNLPNTSHNLTVVKDVAANYMYMHSIVYVGPAPFPTSFRCELTYALPPPPSFTATPIASTSSSVTSSSTTSSDASTTSTAAAPASTPGNSSSSSSSHSSHGAAIGGAIAAVVILLFAAIASFLYRRRRQQRRVARRNSLGPDGRVHAPDPIVPMGMPRNPSERKSVDAAGKDLATPTLDGPSAGSHSWPVLTATPSAEAMEMYGYNRASQAEEYTMTVARQELEKSQAGRQDFNGGPLPAGAAAPSFSHPTSSSSSPSGRPLPPPPGSTTQRPTSMSGGSVAAFGPQSGSSVSPSGQAEPLLPPQLEFIQSLVHRGLDSSAISNVIHMMAAAPPSTTTTRPEGSHQDDAPPAYR